MIESLYLPLDITTNLHLWHLPGTGPPVFLLHGAIENGRIFVHPEAQKGFAVALARQGYDVYVADLAGRGRSTPPIHAGTWQGQNESIHQEIPLMLKTIAQRRPGVPMIWGAHSWGGVLLMAVLARQPHWLNALKGVVFFGTKRSVQGLNFEKALKVYTFWNRLAVPLVRWKGFLPARELKLGADAESRQSHAESVYWVRSKTWLDPYDGFNYARGLQALDLPPLLYLAGQNDFALGHMPDVKNFQTEVGGQRDSFWLLAKSQGFQHNYGHIDMLTHRDAPGDHFPQIISWMNLL